MKLTDNVVVLSVPRGMDAPFHLTLILDEENGPALVDAAFPDQEEMIAARLREDGVEAQDLRRIVITHQDLDHVGSAAALIRGSGARVLANPKDAPYIDGTQRPFKPSPEILEERPHMREVFERLEPVHVDEHLEDGDRLDLAGGLRVIHTPGHTPGHISLYLEGTKTLIAGEALTAEESRLKGPNPPVTLDMRRAMQSVERLADLEVETIACYHGGVVDEDANAQLQGLLAS